MPWIPQSGTATSWTSRSTAAAEVYVGESSTAESWPLSLHTLNLNAAFAPLDGVVQSSGAVMVAFRVGVPGDWDVGLDTPVAIGSGLSLPGIWP